MSADRREVIVLPEQGALVGAAARQFIDRARDAVSTRGIFTVALSGGSTPRPLYELLSAAPYKDEIDWEKVHVFFSDERFVPPDSSASNYHMVCDCLLSKVPMFERFVHPVATENGTPGEAAALYEEGLRRVFAVGLTEVPRFDLVLLGMGEDGHIASLFPGTQAVSEEDRLVVESTVPGTNARRVTFTLKLINAARCVMFLIEGRAKAEAVRRALDGDALPAALVRPTNGELVWLLDESSAGGVAVPVTRRQTL
ncbi:MAG: 6-phosphogluconolactonase [Chloroflexi bacterium]|nr:MAG: 6-phosphogluconolactonase [Chloroflexota bacterium]